MRDQSIARGAGLPGRAVRAAIELASRLELPGLGALLVALTIPRFNQKDWLIGGVTGTGDSHLADAQNYIHVVEFLRGNLDRVHLRVPYAHRLLAPGIAAILPTSPMTALNIVSVIMLVVALIALVAVCQGLGLDRGLSLLGGLLFAVSFPVFYYGAIGTVEATTVAVLTLGLWAVVTDRWTALYPIAFVGAITSGITILVVVVALAVASRSPVNDRGRLSTAAGAAATYAVTLLLVRIFMNPAGGRTYTPGWDALSGNLGRWRAWASWILVLGPPAALAIYGFIKGRMGFGHPHVAGLVAGAGGVAIGFLVALFGLAVDGRFLWLSYPYLIPLAVLLAAHLPDPVSS